MISTDKAANPINLMGASKRAAEIYIQCLAKQINAHYAVVRFGNVMESSGSVVRLFKEAIAQRKPIVVSHRDVSRYFMSKSEAVSLIIRVATITDRGNIFILDMGEPVKIIDLAHEMIRLAGLTPGKDVPISFSGLKPGEKLVEELTADGEELIPTTQEKIFAVNNSNSTLPSLVELVQSLNQIERAIVDHDLDGLRAKIKEIVPSYNPL
jgi:FlaA1/EpsC-like NDP-sugar epimerase